MFREVEGTAAVARELAVVLETVAAGDETITAAAAGAAGAEEEDEAAAVRRLEDLLRSSSTSPFAAFSTSRVKFELDGGDVHFFHPTHS